MKRILIALLLVGNSYALIAQRRADYDLAVSRFQTFYNKQQADSIFDMISDRLKGLMPLGKARQTFQQMYQKWGDLKSCTYQQEKDGYVFYKAEFESDVLKLVVQLNKDNKLEAFRFLPYAPDTSGSNYRLRTATGTIFGTLTLPEQSAGKCPVVLIIAGSGPTDRDCNNPLIGKTNAYLMIADSLQKAGIACVRYDKRGVGASAAAMTDEASLSFEDIVNDAAGFIRLLKADGRFSRVYVLGHSEGSLVGMLAMEREKADGFISVAGAGEPADKIVERQYASQSLELGETAKVMFDSLKSGYTVKDVPDNMSALFHASVQPYLRSWVKYDPAREIARLREPALIVQGTTDIQVGTDQAELLSKGCKHATLKIIEGMNHVLKQAPEDRMQNAATYSMPDLPLCPGFMASVDTFVK